MATYQRVRENGTGRTGVAEVRQDRPGDYWVFWDDAASYPCGLASRYLTILGAACADDIVCYRPGKPQHGLRRGDAVAQGILAR